MSRVIVRDVSTGAVTFDSTKEFVLAQHAERHVTGGEVGTGAGITVAYPELAWQRIQAFLTSPYQSGEVDGWAVLSCRVTYPNGIPTISIFGDESRSDLPVCDGLLIVLKTGAPL